MTSGKRRFLRAGAFIDWKNPAVIAFARTASAGGANDVQRSIALYRAVRDTIIYDPYIDLADPMNYRASAVLALGRGFCIGKAALLAACARAIGIPARVGYADVRNHMTSRRLYERTKSDVFPCHSFTDLHLDGSWFKATPAFDAALCQRVALAPLEFDGRSDSLFHSFDQTGRRHMEYLRNRGTFEDVPFEAILKTFRRHYPGLFSDHGIVGDFASEALAGATGFDDKL